MTHTPRQLRETLSPRGNCHQKKHRREPLANLQTSVDFFLHHPKILIHTQTTKTVNLDSTKEKYVARSEKGYKVIEFPFRTIFTKI